jgi:hypothetical protein
MTRLSSDHSEDVVRSQERKRPQLRVEEEPNVNASRFSFSQF